MRYLASLIGGMLSPWTAGVSMADSKPEKISIQEDFAHILLLLVAATVMCVVFTIYEVHPVAQFVVLLVCVAYRADTVYVGSHITAVLITNGLVLGMSVSIVAALMTIPELETAGLKAFWWSVAIWAYIICAVAAGFMYQNRVYRNKKPRKQ